MQRVRLSSLTRDGLDDVRRACHVALEQDPRVLELDFTDIRAFDSAGAAELVHLVRRAEQQNCSLQAIHVHPSIARSLDLFPAHTGVLATEPPGPGPYLEQLGDSLGQVLGIVLETLDVLVALGRAAWDSLRVPRRSTHTAWLAQMEAVGVQALPVVALIAFLVGVTVALQSAAQLRQFGANVYVVDLVAVAITRELGPLMAAIVVAGRSGAAAAAEVATMVITEEIDALRTMGIHPVRYVVLPKVMAIALTQPLLAVLANATAILGSFFVALFYLDISPTTFWDRLQQALMLKDIGLGLVKSTTFGVLIMLIAAVVGLRTQGGADAVGRSTTTSVVVAIFAIIVADAAFSLLFYFGD